jgi:putative transposase
VRYVERNAKKANLVKRAEDWRWSSIWRRENISQKQIKLLSSWLISQPDDYLQLLNKSLTQSEEEALERSEAKDVAYGNDTWVEKVVKKFGLEQTLRKIGRPWKL